MYIEKRWLVPAALSLLLLGVLLAVVLLLLGASFTQLSGPVRPAEITSVVAESKPPTPVVERAPIPEPPPDAAPVVPVAPAAAAAPVILAAPAPVAAVASATPVALVAPAPVVTAGAQVPEEVVDIETVDSEATQVTTRGFGDVGMQFQDVIINAPITIVHVSNEGNNNSTNANLGKENRITSEQEDLQSNRSDGTAAPTAAGQAPPPTVAATPTP